LINAPAAGTPYRATIGNVMIETQLRSFTYTVIVFDPGY